MLPIEDVAVAGARHTSAAGAAEASGLRGAPVFRASAVEARARLRGLPAVLDADVEIALPGVARVQLVEREPVGRWVSGATEWLIDAEGVLFASVDPAGAPELRVTDARGALRAGERVDPALVAAAMRLARIAPGELRADETRPTVRLEAGSSGLVLRSGGRWEIRFGGPDRFEEKLQAARAYLKNNPDRPLDYVDVARPEFIVVRPE